ncbi:MAG: outer membrane protein assembly factor BamD [Candidatus Stygibacter frigidus]|nr:outer membrane protein assembly factor BamD [Candidatus Stygibacter frigidus]
MLKKIWTPALLIIILLLSACSSTNAIQKMSPENAKQTADNYFAMGKYKKAIPYYQKIVNESSTILLADSQMRLADCFFFRKEYIDARFEYEEFIRQFSDHPEVARAFFQIGVCYYKLSLDAHYDQDDTFSAIDAFSEYIDRYPFDENKNEALKYIKDCRYKLLEKKYHNGYAYYKLSDFPSALLYFNEIIELNNHDQLDKKALYYSAKMYLYRKDLENTDLMLAKLSLKYPDDKKTEIIQRKRDKLAKKLDK